MAKTREELEKENEELKKENAFLKECKNLLDKLMETFKAPGAKELFDSLSVDKDKIIPLN